MKRISFFVLLIILLIFTSACSNTASNTNSNELETEGMQIGQTLGFGDGLFQVTVYEAEIQGSDLTLNIQVENNSDKQQIVKDVMNFSITQNGTDLSGDTNGFKETDDQAFNYTIDPGADADLTLEYTLPNGEDPIEIIVTPGDNSGFNIPGESELNITINPKESTVDANEVKIEG